MSTFQITLPTASFPSTFDKAYPDLGMSDASLLLMDFSHPAGYDYRDEENEETLIVPANDIIIPNIAHAQAAAILGSGTRDSLSSRFKQSGLAGASSAKHRIEFTGKKGLHTILGQTTNPLTSGDHIRFTFADPIFNYIFAGTPGHNFFFAVWRRITRAQVTGSLTQPFLMVGQSGSVNLCLHDNGNGINTGTADKFTDGAVNTLGNHYSDWRSNPWTGTKPGSPAAEGGFRWSWLCGSFASYAGSNLDKAASQIFYRLHIKDLDVTGETYAEAHKTEYDLYQKAFAPGGRFYNDTFTAPSTVP